MSVVTMAMSTSIENKRRPDDAGLQPDVDDDEFGEAARVHERADSESAAIVLAGQRAPPPSRR